MVFKSSLADKAKQRLQPGNAHDSSTAKGVQAVVGEFAFAYIAADAAVVFIGRESRIAHVACLYLAGHRAVCVLFSNGARNDGLKIHHYILEKMFGQVAAME